MRIKFLASFGGPEIDWPVNSEQEVEQAEAIRLIDAGFAVPVASKPIETAVRKPVETRAKRKSK